MSKGLYELWLGVGFLLGVSDEEEAAEEGGSELLDHNDSENDLALSLLTRRVNVGDANEERCALKQEHLGCESASLADMFELSVAVAEDPQF